MARERRAGGLRSGLAARALLSGSFLILFLLMAALGAAQAGQAHPLASFLARVVIAPEPAVSGDVIRLGEIARIESEDPALADKLQALEVGRAALPGQSRVVSVGTLRLRMRQARLPERQIVIESPADAFPVLTRYEALSAEALKNAVERWYAEYAVLPPEARLVLTVNAGDEIVPPGHVEIKVALDAPRWGNVAVPLEIHVDGRLYKRVFASAEALVEQPVWVATRSFARGEEVSEDDVELVVRRFSQPVAGPQDWREGLRTTRFVREGTPLTWENVEPVPDVRKGERVLIIAQKGSVLVQVAGEILADGRIGEKVAARNLSSGSVVYGILTSDRAVLVEVW